MSRPLFGESYPSLASALLDSISRMVGLPRDTFPQPLGVLIQPLPARSLNSSANPNVVKVS